MMLECNLDLLGESFCLQILEKVRVNIFMTRIFGVAQGSEDLQATCLVHLS